MKKTEIFKLMYTHYSVGSDFIDKIPTDISDSYFDNPYCNSLWKMIDILSEELFTYEEQQWIDWFLFEWHDNRDLYVTFDDVDYTFDTIDEFIDILIKEERWD